MYVLSGCLLKVSLEWGVELVSRGSRSSELYCPADTAAAKLCITPAPPLATAPPPLICRRRRRPPRPRFYLPLRVNARPPLRGSMNTVLNGILIRWE